MGNKASRSNYSGPRYVSKDGNVYDNPFDQKAADTRYDQQEKIKNELKIKNGTYEPSSSEILSRDIVALLFKVPIITMLIIPAICIYFLIKDFEMHPECLCILIIDGLIVFAQIFTLLEGNKNPIKIIENECEKYEENGEDRIDIKLNTLVTDSDKDDKK